MPCLRISDKSILKVLAGAIVTSEFSTGGKICFQAHSGVIGRVQCSPPGLLDQWPQILAGYWLGASLSSLPFHGTAHIMVVSFNKEGREKEDSESRMEITVFL